MLHPKKVGKLLIEGGEEEKQTNEIKTAIPLLEAIAIEGRTITADALLTQRELATYLVDQRRADYHFTVKSNHKTMLQEIAFHFDGHSRSADAETTDAGHGRIETRRIWVSTALNSYLRFPHVGQVFKIERITVTKKCGKTRREVIYGITSKTPLSADPAQVLQDNRGHWSVESMHHIIDWNYDEDRHRIRTGHGPENITRLRRFSIGLLKTRGNGDYVRAQMMRLGRCTRLVFDYLRLTQNTGLSHAI